MTATSNYRMSFEPARNRVCAEFNGVVVADSERAILLRETRYPAVYYFPKEDLHTDLMRATEHHTHCPFKGNATYWTLEVEGMELDNVAWSYEEPLHDAEALRGYVAFYFDRLDAWYQDEEKVFERETEIAFANPLVDWLLREGWDATTRLELTDRLRRVIDAKLFPVLRMMVAMRTLHPQIFATAHVWLRSEGEMRVFHGDHAFPQDSRYTDSPMRPVIEGHGGIRRQLEGPNAELDYPILHELIEEGATDYVAFSDGQINMISLATDRPGGFKVGELGLVHEILPMLARLYEVHHQREVAGTLLDTYLGAHSGQRVLQGLIQRGDGEDIPAVIWFSDLRASTELAERLPRPVFLALLNQFLDAMAGAVLDAGGAVLRFIGDSALAIFPIADFGGDAEACLAALTAAEDAEARIAAINQELTAEQGGPIRYGIGLHLGDVTYGNIGTERRLEFTVVGPAANCAARVESQCKELGETVIVSEEVANAVGHESLRPLGRHKLRGIDEPIELFALV